jgi:hypothetical protein
MMSAKVKGVWMERVKGMQEVTTMTRQERRAKRLRRFVTTREARLAAHLARLDYKVSGETGVMRVPSRVRTWHLGNRLNGHVPPPGQKWDRSGPAYVVETAELGRLSEPVIHSRWRRLMKER